MSANTTPDATATPRTDANTWTGIGAWDEDSAPLRECVTADFARTLKRELSSAQAALAEAKAEVAGLRTALEIRNQVWDDEFGWIHKNAIVTLAALRAEVADLKAAGGPPFIRSEAIRNLRDQVCGLKVGNDQLRARVAGLQRLLGEVYRNTNLRHHPELTGLADIVSKQLST